MALRRLIGRTEDGAASGQPDECSQAAAASAPTSDRPAKRGTRSGVRDAPGFSQPLPPAERVDVHVVLERQQLEDLELIVRHRHGSRSRSEVVRRAVRWYLAKEADWLIRQRRADELRRRREAELEQARSTSAAERAELQVEAKIRTAVELAGGQGGES